MTRIVCTLLLLMVVYSSSKAQTTSKIPKGTLFIIGGGDISDSLRREILTTAGWKKGDMIAAVTLASTWDSAFLYTNDVFKKLTGQDCINIDSATIHNPLTLDSLKKAKIIYLGGGDQDRFMNLIKGTSVKQIIKQSYYNGALIAGTSAGASVMSEKMITGNSTRDKEYSATFREIYTGNLEVKEGLGLLDSVIIDQHFVVRSRYNRMLTAVMDYPSFQCIGINESTAIIVNKGKARVTGESQVIVFSHPKGKKVANGYLGARSILVSVLLPGELFPIKR